MSAATVLEDKSPLPIEQREIETRKIRIRAADDFMLHGTTYQAEDAVASILVAPGTGIPQYFYDAYCTYLAQRGYAVLTFDFRGVGESAPRALRGFEATKVDWGKYDLSAAFGRTCHEWPELPHFVLGHSVGGQLLGLTSGFDRIDAIATYGTGFGYWGQIATNYRYFVGFLWYVGIPVLTSVFGYMPAKRFGLGEDLPAGVVKDWARWGKRQNYFEDEIGDAPGFKGLDAPWRAFLAEDDLIATRENADGLHALYAREVEVEMLCPDEFGYDEIGHLKFFSRSRRNAWHVIPDWFDTQYGKN